MAKVAGEFVALLAIAMEPVTLPVTVGLKVALNVAAWPGDRMSPEDRPLVVKPAPEYETPEMVTLAVPEFVIVADFVAMALRLTLPKLKLVGLTVSNRVPALTVSTAALLVTLPTAFVT